MAYNVSQDFTNKLYSGESNFRAILTIGENTIDNDQIASISISSPIIDDSKQVFYVGSFISQKITIKFKNMDGIDVHSGDNVDLSIGQYVNNEWVDVPIGKFLVDDLAEDYFEKCEISCLDYAVKFKPNIDYSLCFTNGKATIKEILEYICDYFNVEIGDYPTINDDVEIGTYDSTVSGKQWISYIAELKGCNAKIDRLGRLTLQPLKQPSNVPINALESASFELGEEFNITKVTFFDAIRNYTYGDDEGNTLFIRQDNPFITDTKVVQNIYDNLCAIKYSASGKYFDIEDADAHQINVNTIYGETSQPVLPSGYQAVEYIESTGTQYINTGIYVNSDLRVVIDFENNNSSIDGNIFGGRQGANSNTFVFFLWGSNNKFRSDFYNTSNQDTQLVSAVGRFIVDKNRDATTVYKDNKSYFRVVGYTQFQGTRPLILFAKDNNGTIDGKVAYKLYSCKIYDNDKLVRNLIPCYNTSNNVIGLYDLANNVFLTNSGTGTFTKGANISIPSLTIQQEINNFKGNNALFIRNKNLFDGVLEKGYYDGNTGKKVANDNLYRNANSILVEPNTTYTLSIDGIKQKYVLYYYSDNKMIGYNENQTGTFTTPNNCKYVNFRCYASDFTPDFEQLSIQFEKGNNATEYIYPQESKTPLNLITENLFDGELELGGYQNGVKDNNTDRYRCVNKISVKPNTNYTFSINGVKQPYVYQLYDANKTYIGDNNTQGTFATPSNCYYITFRCFVADFTNDFVNLKVKLEQGTKANTYTPYATVPFGYNLFDKNDYNIMTAWFSDAQPTITRDVNTRLVYIPCKPNATYTISKTPSARFSVGYTNSEPAYEMSVAGVTGSINGETNIVTINTGASAQYIVIYMYHTIHDSDITLSHIINSIRIEEGYSTHDEYKTLDICNISDYVEKDKIYQIEGKNLYINPLNIQLGVGDYNPVKKRLGNNSFSITCNKTSSTSNTCFAEVPLDISKFKPNTVYTLSKKHMIVGTSYTHIGAIRTHINGSYGSINNTNTLTFTTPSSIESLSVLFYVGWNNTQTGSCTITFYEIQVEEKNIATTFEPYGDKGDWFFKHKTGKILLDGRTHYGNTYATLGNGTGGIKRFQVKNTTMIGNVPNDKITTYSNIFKGIAYTGSLSTPNSICQWNADNMFAITTNSTTMTLAEFKTMLINKPIYVYCCLPFTQYEKITYTPLIEQLNELQNTKLFEGTNYITVDTLNKQPSLDIDYFKDSHFSLWSLKTHNYGDFTLDAWDNIDYDLDGTHYLTLNNNNIKYEMSIMGDVESKIPTKQQEVTTNIIGGDDNTNIKMIKTTVDHLNGQVDIISGKQTDMLTDISDLQVANNTITSTVERIEKVEIGKDDTVGLRHRISQTEQKVDTITDMFQITGGINIIRNSAFLLSDDVWDFTDYGTNPYHTPLGNSYNSSLSGTIISVAEIKARSMKIKSKSENITNLIVDAEGKTKYTFNFYHKQDADMTTTIKMYSTENNNIKAFNDIVITGQQPLKNYEVSFVPTYANYTLEIIVASATSIGYAYLYDMMLNAGDKQSWQPASDEIYSTTLQMSRLGLQVYSVGDGTITLLGSDGLTSWETSDGKTKGRLVSKRTIDGDRVKTITTQSVKLVSDATKTDEELTHEDKWVETTTKVSGKIAKVIYMESGV